MQVHHPNKKSLTCQACAITLLSQQQYKQHYKSDFHRYNTKRRMIKLPPATEQQFKAKKIQAIRQQPQIIKCNQCGKQFGTIQTLNQHAQSKNHDPNLIRQSKIQEIAKTQTVQLKNEKQCLFCLEMGSSLLENLQHMKKQHSFFVPSEEFCIDKKNLIIYLQQKIQVGYLCIKCENKKSKDFQSGDAVRHHMIDKGHCFMKTQEGYEEYEKFYDFSQQFYDKINEQQNRTVSGIQFEEVQVIQKQNENEDSDQWEDEEEIQQENQNDNQDQWQSADQQDDVMVEQTKQQMQEQPKKTDKKQKTKKYLIMRPTLTTHGQLLLPNGKTLGARKYKHLYKQYLRQSHEYYVNTRQLQLGYNEQRALVTNKQMFQLKRLERMMKNKFISNKKNYLKVGMANNIQLHYRCQNSL